MLKILNNYVYNVIFRKKKGDKSTGMLVHANSEAELFDFICTAIIEKGYTLISVSEIGRDGFSYKINLDEDESYKKAQNDLLKKLEAKKVIEDFLSIENYLYTFEYFARNICNEVTLRTKEYTYDLSWGEISKLSSDVSKDECEEDINYFMNKGISRIRYNKENLSKEKEVLILKNCRVPILNMLTKYTYVYDFDFKEDSYYESIDENFKSQISDMKIDFKVVKTITDEPVSYCDITINTENLNRDLATNLINALVEYHAGVREEIDYIWGCCIPF